MAIKITIDSPEDLREHFRKYDRDNFTLDGYQALIDYYDDSCEDIELDVVAIDCDWCESEWKDIQSNYCNHEDLAECDNIDDFLEALNNYTMAIRTTGDNILYIYF